MRFVTFFFVAFALVTLSAPASAFRQTEPAPTGGYTVQFFAAQGTGNMPFSVIDSIQKTGVNIDFVDVYASRLAKQDGAPLTVMLPSKNIFGGITYHEVQLMVGSGYQATIPDNVEMAPILAIAFPEQEGIAIASVRYAQHLHHVLIFNGQAVEGNTYLRQQGMAIMSLVSEITGKLPNIIQ